MEIIAHRGASYDAPENTLTAVRLAWDQDADAVEVDVCLSRDNRLVVIHDSNTKRTGGVDKPVNAQTLPELRTLDVGRWKAAKWRGEWIPTLDEVLATVPPGKRLYIEIKCGPEAIQQLGKTIDRTERSADWITVIGFSAATLTEIKAALPVLETRWVVRFTQTWKSRQWSPTARRLIETATQAGLGGVHLEAHGPVDAITVEELKAAGLSVVVWTIDSPGAARRMAGAGVDGITTNRPRRLREALNRLNRQGFSPGPSR